ncbi:MAG: NifB/NifX family molybdenum-iron cluster-binding protein [Candidatus Izemoplasmatales bacterium]
MRIAVAQQAGNVSEHFGHCESFILFDQVGSELVERETIPNPAHQPGQLQTLLSGRHVDVVITGGIGAGAVERFEAMGVKIVSGITGPVRKACLDYLAGVLTSAGSTCGSHRHHVEGCGHD